MSLLEVNEFIVQKKIFSAHEHYDFHDVHGNKLGEADGNVFQIPPRFQIKDNHDVELMHMQGKALSLQWEFTVFSQGGETLGNIKKKPTTFTPEYWVEKDGQELIRIRGNFAAHEYRMEMEDQTVAAVHRKWVSLRDQMSVEITGNVDRRIVIGTVVVIEHVEAVESHSFSSISK